jgi:putative acetyltransferase
MSGEAHAKLSLRPMLPADGRLLADIFRASVEELTGDDYTGAQQDAWTAVADDEKAFVAKLAGQLTLIATLGGSPVGFVSLEGADKIDKLYVHPAVAGQGAGRLLIEAVERLAAGRRAEKLIVDASDNARDFFAKRGYVAQQRNSVTLNGEWLANTTMYKPLVNNKKEAS